MIVYVIPVGTDRYELYCDDATEALEVEDVPSGMVARLAGRYRAWLARIEHERRHPPKTPPGDRHAGVVRRLTDRALSRLSEIIAEQRLLWRLRQVAEARAVFPDDISEAEAADVVRRALGRDASRHRTWLAVYALGFAVSGLLAVFPGPNLIAYYLAFRLVGHYLSLKGARHGLTGVRWTREQNHSLTDLRHATALPGPQRDARVEEIASGLRLPRLAGFFKRVAVPGA
jgi:hypothetical protein